MTLFVYKRQHDVTEFPQQESLGKNQTDGQETGATCDIRIDF